MTMGSRTKAQGGECDEEERGTVNDSYVMILGGREGEPQQIPRCVIIEGRTRSGRLSRGRSMGWGGDMGVMGKLREGNEFTTSPRGQFNLGTIRLSVT